MPFTPTSGNVLALTHNGADFTEEVLTLTGAGSVAVTKSGAAYTISGTPASSVSITVEDGNVLVYSGAAQLDFGTGFTITSGTGEANITINEADLTTVVFLTGDQDIAGNKAFTGAVALPFLNPEPADSNDNPTGFSEGEVRIGDDYLYISTGGVWKRTALSIF